MVQVIVLLLHLKLTIQVFNYGKICKGKFALAISDISGQAFPWNEMVTQWNGLFVHFSEFESKQPQLDPKPSAADPTALPKSRPQQPPPDTLRF